MLPLIIYKFIQTTAEHFQGKRTAAALTTALGNAYIGMLMKVCRGEMDLSELSTKKGQELMKQEFQNQMKAKKN